MARLLAAVDGDALKSVAGDLGHLAEDRPSSGGLPVHRDVLAFGEGEQPFGATLAAQTALFHAPERRGRVGDQPSIEADHAGLDSLANAKATREIRRIDVGN